MKKALFALFLMLTLCSCGAATTSINRSNSVISNTSETKKNFSRQSPYSHPEKQASQQASQQADNSQDISRAGKIASVVRVMNNIENAAVIIMDETAVIGIDITTDLSEEQVISIKNEIEQKVKQCDTEIKRVTITTAPDLTEEIAELSTNEMDGAPKVTGALENIIKRVTPTV